MSSQFIRYEVKNGVQYAAICYPERVNGKKRNRYEHLGRVVDKERGVFQSKLRGLFAYTPQQGYITDAEALAPFLEQVPLSPTSPEKLIVDFGDAWLLHELFPKSPYFSMIRNAFAAQESSICALLFYKILANTSPRHAQTWLEGAYVSLLFPKADLRSQNITSLLRFLGDEALQRVFFKAYLAYLCPNARAGILIDSTGLPNSIDFPLTATNVHENQVSQETRLILIVDRLTNLPLFFRYNAGNIVDVSTLTATINELQALGVKTQYALVDAGYYSNDNVDALYAHNIAFLSRLGANRKLYKEIINEHIDDVLQVKYAVLHNKRVVHIKKIPVTLTLAHQGFAYLAVDRQRKNDESYAYMKEALQDKIDGEEMERELKKFGAFVLISSENVSTREILSLYYTRQVIEQIFDFTKNNLDLIPIRVHSEATFRGHLMLTFLASILLLPINQKLNEGKHCTIEVFSMMRNLKCKIYDHEILVKEPTKKMKKIAELLQVKIPLSLPRPNV
jgi:CRISPR/Cas system CSM-associated protein Csm2 small subunit